jgi:hypothetical protein
VLLGILQEQACPCVLLKNAVFFFNKFLKKYLPKITKPAKFYSKAREKVAGMTCKALRYIRLFYLGVLEHQVISAGSKAYQTPAVMPLLCL